MTQDHAPLTPALAPVAACHALIPCAGTGSRSGLQSPKQYQVLAGQRLIDHTVDAFLGSRVADVTVVVSPDDCVYAAAHERVQALPVGGSTRAHSVFQGLAALRQQGVPDSDWVLVHDAARCLLTAEQVNALIDACANDPVGGLLALPLPDTLKAATGGEPARVAETVERADKWLAQTPQMFRVGDLYRALQQTEPGGFAGITDEASAIEALGLSPRLVRGSAQNFKVTYPEDFALAEALLRQRMVSV